MMDGKEKCPSYGFEISKNSIICMNCGRSLTESTIDDAVEELKEKTPIYKVDSSSAKSPIKGVGFLLMIVGGLADLLGLVFGGSDSFSFFLIGGGVFFFIGFLLTFI